LASVGTTVNITFILSKGDVCFYKIKSQCGLTKLDFLKMDNSDSIISEYMEFERGQLQLGSEATNSKTGGAPGSDMPWRTETFVYDAARKVY
jgi:hypothetical protein